MPRYEKGILGVKKDPKKKVLLLFGVGKGSESWPSDDSDDSDYQPVENDNIEAELKQEVHRKTKRIKTVNIRCSDEDSDYEPETVKKKSCHRSSGSKTQSLENGKKKQRIHKNRGKNTKQHTTSKDTVVSKGTSLEDGSVHKQRMRIAQKQTDSLTGNLWGEQIPPEVLTKIFSYVVEQNGALPFLSRVGRVCLLWNDVASGLMLWRNVDLSYGWIKKSDHWLHWLCDHRLEKVRTLDLSGWEKIVKEEQLTYIGEKCPHLEDISLKGCTKITAQSLFELVTCCQKLHSLDLSHQENQQSSRIKADFTMAKHLNILIESLGDRLRKLNLSHHSLANFTAVLKTISMRCSSLRELDLSMVKFSSDYLTVDVEALQKGCPRLTTLRLNCAMIRPTAVSPNWEDSVGWDELEELQIGTWNQSYTGFTESTLQRLLKSSRWLRLLNIRGCKSIGGQVLSELCCLDLEQLYMTWTKVPMSACLAAVLRKWNHSLQELDIAWCGSYCDSFSQDLSELCQPNSKLHTLDLSGSTMDMEALRFVLSGCQRITTLAVSSCRSLDPCYKRRYTDAGEIRELWKKLKI